MRWKPIGKKQSVHKAFLRVYCADFMRALLQVHAKCDWQAETSYLRLGQQEAPLLIMVNSYSLLASSH